MKVAVKPSIAPATRQARVSEGSAPELSIVMPCLNEAETLEACISKAQHALHDNQIDGEIIIADNGSTDGSKAIAARMGVRVVEVQTKGYGSALRGGIAAARGTYIIMGDADNSYDFSQIPLFLDKLHGGFDLVVGNRFKGGIRPGSMRWLHRYVGVPVLTRLAHLFFSSPCGDNHCGLRGFSRAAVMRMGLRASGWEFGSEMIAKANLLQMRIAEVPITLLPDGRTRPSHLRTWEAGWQHLELMLAYCPRWLFFYPGMTLMLVGFLAGSWLLSGPKTMGGVTFNIHTLLYAATAILLGFQSVVFAAFAELFSINEGLKPVNPRLIRVFRAIKPELGLVVGVLLVILGLWGSLYAVHSWEALDFGPLDTNRGLRLVIPSVLSLTLGGEVILSSFFLSFLQTLRN